MNKKILIIEKCNDCKYYENNMYHGSCCWHDKVSKKVPEGKIPKKIQEHFGYGIKIPLWCPLENFKEDK